VLTNGGTCVFNYSDSLNFLKNGENRKTLIIVTSFTTRTSVKSPSFSPFFNILSRSHANNIRVNHAWSSVRPYVYTKFAGFKAIAMPFTAWRPDIEKWNNEAVYLSWLQNLDFGKGYYDGVFQQEDTTCELYQVNGSESYPFTLGSTADVSSKINFFFTFYIDTVVAQSTIDRLNNEPYKLLEPVSRPLYFDLSSLPSGSLDFIFNANNTSVLNTAINLQRNNLINIETADTINTIDNNIVRNSIVDIQNMSAIDNITTLLNRYCTIDVQNMSVIDSVTSLLNRYYDIDVQNISTVANIVSLLNRYYTVDVQNTFVIDSIISLLNRYYTIGIENSVSIEDILISTGNILYFSLSLENGLTIPDTYLYKNINCSINPTNSSTIDDIVFSVIRCLEADLLNNTPIDTIVYNVIRTINMSLENTEYMLDIPIFIEELLNILEINGFIKETFTGNIKEIYNGTIN
jgi:hypothetical protein